MSMVVEDLVEFVRERHPDVFTNCDVFNLPPTEHNDEAASTSTVRLLIDAEDCLHRLYGGHFSDWVSGGQWSRLFEFVSQLKAAATARTVTLTVALDGAALDQQRLDQWVAKQTADGERVKQLSAHLRRRQTQPPKQLWVAPAGLRLALRLALRQVGVDVHQTLADHRQEVVALLRGRRFAALLADGAEYVWVTPTRLCSAARLKLTFRATLETQQLALADVAACFQLPIDRCPLFAALLGSFILPSSQLAVFHKEVMATTAQDQRENAEVLITALAAFVRSLPQTGADDIGRFVFRSVDDAAERAALVAKFERAVHYFQAAQIASNNEDCDIGVCESGEAASAASDDGAARGCDASVSEVAEQLAVLEAAGNEEEYEMNGPVDTPPTDTDRTGGSSTSTALSSSPVETEPPVVPDEADVGAAAACAQAAATVSSPPPVPFAVLDVCRQRHRLGRMHPWVLQVLSKQEIRLEVGVEDTAELPSCATVWRAVRQAVYAVLLDLNHKAYMRRQAAATEQKPAVADGSTEVSVREWAPSGECASVAAAAVEWRGVPTVHTLWMRHDCGAKRIKAFLTCMRADTPLMATLPKEYLLPCCVLRYLLRYRPERVLQAHELDAFLSVAVSPQLHNPTFLQSLPVQSVKLRNAALARLFMVGVEQAAFANDACGSPLPAAVCAPWRWFDGRLLQMKLDMAVRRASLVHLCHNELQSLALATRLRAAIVDEPVGPPASVEQLAAVARGRRMIGSREILTRGGQLEIAGKVVGRWSGQKGDAANAAVAAPVLMPRAPFNARLAPPPPQLVYRPPTTGAFRGAPLPIGLAAPPPLIGLRPAPSVGLRFTTPDVPSHAAAAAAAAAAAQIARYGFVAQPNAVAMLPRQPPFFVSVPRPKSGATFVRANGPILQYAGASRP